MTFAGVFLIVVVLIVVIWLLLGFKRFKHKIFSFFLIALVLFLFLSFIIIFKGKEVSIKNISDLGNVFKIYFSWFGNLFGNIKTITGQVTKMNWQGNQTPNIT